MHPYKSSSLVHPLLSLTHWIFRSLMLPYKSSSHSSKCVRCASLRSGGCRLAVRTAMDHPIGALPRTPFPASRDFPSRGNEKIGGTGYCVTYDTDSQSRNVLASPLGEEGHEVAKGCTRVRMIMILDVDVTAEGGIIKLIARKGNPTPFELSEPSEPTESGPRSGPFSPCFFLSVSVK